MKKILLLMVAVLFFGWTFAHQPRLIFEQPAGQAVQVKNPEISQAFYGILSGQPDIYQIMSDTGFHLYVNIVVPAFSGQRTDFSVDIQENDNEIYHRLDGSRFQWTDFYEPFGGDTYLRGPSFEQDVGPGVYTIRVYTPDNQGKYSLAIGKIESFDLKETIHTYKVMPDLKIEFFQKPRYLIYWNYVGAFLFAVILVSTLFLRGVIKMIKRIAYK